MLSRLLLIVSALFLCFLLNSCAGVGLATNFPSPDDVFVTTGDGDIQKPYTPIGQLIYSRTGFRIPIILFGFIPIDDVDPDYELRTAIFNKVKKMGGDGLINMQIAWEPASSGFLGFFAWGGRVFVTGTVIKR